MKLDYETKIKIRVITDFVDVSLNSKAVEETIVKVKEVISFIDFVMSTYDTNIELCNKSLTLSFDKSLISLVIISPNINWKNIYIFKNVYEFYEKI